MKDIIKYAILGVAGYWIYKNYGSSWFGTTPVTSANPSSVAPVYTHDTKTDVYNAARTGSGIGWNGLLNGDQWNWYYKKVRGVDGPDPSLVWPNQDRGFAMDVNEYWQGVTKVGMGRYGYGMGRYLRTGVGRRNYYLA